MKFKTVIPIIIFLLIIFSCSTALAGTDNDENDGDYYFGYGDSIAAGKGTSGSGTFDFSSSFFSRLCTLYDTSNTIDHMGMEGGGNKVSYPYGHAWDCSDNNAGYGTRYYYDWTNHSNNTYFMWMLGINDCWVWYTDTGANYNGTTADYAWHNMSTGNLKIYNETVENGTIPLLIIPTSINTSYGTITVGEWNDYFNPFMELCKNYSIRYVPGWDAVDDIPWDGTHQSLDSAYNSYGVHLNQDGQDALAEMLYYFINHWDYNISWHNVNSTLFVDVDYNETIFINNSLYNWDTDNLTIRCLNNDTVIGFDIQTAINGSEMIRFDGVKGMEYMFRDPIAENCTWTEKEFGVEVEILELDVVYWRQAEFGIEVEILEEDVVYWQEEEFGVNVTILAPAPANETNYVNITNNGTDYFCWKGDNCTLSDVAENITGFDEEREYVAVWVNSTWDDDDWCWDKYFGDDSGIDATVHQLDVIKVFMYDGAGEQMITMNSSTLIDCNRTVTLDYTGTTGNKGYNYTCYCCNIKDLMNLSEMADEIGLQFGEVVSWWDNSSYEWRGWIEGISSETYDYTINVTSPIFETKVHTDVDWVIGCP